MIPILIIVVLLFSSFAECTPKMPTIATWHFRVYGANRQRGLAIEKYNRALKLDRSDFVWERPFDASKILFAKFGGLNGSFAEGLVTESATYTVTTDDSGQRQCQTYDIGDGGWFDANYFDSCKSLGLVNRSTDTAACQGATRFDGYRCGYFGVFSSFFLLPDVDPAVPCLIETADGLFNYALISWQNNVNTTWPLDPAYAAVPSICH
jgi:hypothetical protein